MEEGMEVVPPDLGVEGDVFALKRGKWDVACLSYSRVVILLCHRLRVLSAARWECFSQVIVVSLGGSKDGDEREGASLSIQEYICCPLCLLLSGTVPSRVWDGLLPRW
jgi:hypothetical protein